jgi:cellulose synthase/poly-beta-1,6-N-acetylglucosamine synthase-like glycosyltransferase
MRLARAGYDVAVLNSTTFEEAPDSFSVWLGQRTRWLKGWMQTWLVHTRAPRRLWRELGPKRFAAFQLVLGGAIVSALVHPWFYVLALADLSGGGPPLAPEWLARLVWWATSANLLVGYGAAILLGMAAVRQRGLARLMPAALLMPVYWLLISLAAYCAVVDLARRPFDWAKTPHKPRGAAVPVSV